MQKHVNLVDLGKSFPTRIYLQNMASIPPRTSTCEIDSRLQDCKIASCQIAKLRNCKIAKLQNCKIAGVRQNIGAAPGARPAPAAPGGPGEDRPRAERSGAFGAGDRLLFSLSAKIGTNKRQLFQNS